MLGACATTPREVSDGEKLAAASEAEDTGEERVYMTGSNIPRKKRLGDVSTADVNATRDAIRQQMPHPTGGGT